MTFSEFLDHHVYVVCLFAYLTTRLIVNAYLTRDCGITTETTTTGSVQTKIETTIDKPANSPVWQQIRNSTKPKTSNPSS